MPRRKRVRPELVVGKFCEGLRLGMTYKLAAKYAGVGESTVYSWLAMGEGKADQGKKIRKAHREFLDAVKAAESESAATLLAQVRLAAKDPARWQAAAWLLERRWPEFYGRISRAPIVEVSSDEGITVTFNLPEPDSDTPSDEIVAAGSASLDGDD